MKIVAILSFYFFFNELKTSYCLPPVHNLPNATQSDQENGSRKPLLSENVKDFTRKYGLSIMTKEGKLMYFNHGTQKWIDLNKETERRQRLNTQKLNDVKKKKLNADNNSLGTIFYHAIHAMREYLSGLFCQ